MTGNKCLVTWRFGYYDSGLYLINCSQLSSWIQRQKTAWETHKRKRTENNEEWFFLWIKQSNPLRHRKNTNDTIHMCCKHNGLKMLLWTATFPSYIWHPPWEERVLCWLQNDVSVTGSHFNWAQMPLLMAPLFASDYLSPNLDGQIREHHQDQQL